MKYENNTYNKSDKLFRKAKIFVSLVE